jgi:hypothetical protein
VRPMKQQKKRPKVGTLSGAIFDALRCYGPATSRMVLERCYMTTAHYSRISSTLAHFEARGLVEVVGATLTVCGPVMTYDLTKHARTMR